MRASVLLLGVALAFLGTGCAEEPPLPEELIGTYTTSEQTYAERSLELTSREVVFGLGDAGTSRHVIESVSREDDQAKTLYTLAYAGEGGTDHLIFYHDAAHGGSIVLHNQTSITWSRQGAEQ